MPVIDLHTHSHYSDGTCAPAELVRRAKARGVELLALSDHDTVDGWREAKAEAERLGVDLRPAIEINTVVDNVHLLGYGIDPDSPALAARLAEFRRRRERRLDAILARLRAAGIELEPGEVRAGTRQTLGRPHVADALRRRGLVATRAEAFEKWLSRGRPGYAEPMGPGFEEAVETIREAGGFPVLAHPNLIRNGELKLSERRAAGLAGLEAYYLGHKAGETEGYLKAAGEHGLLATGGSDFHGPGSGRERIGGVEVPRELFEELKERL